MQSILRKTWDYIVIGTGMGGTVAGYSLARAGKSVLFLEKGRSHLSGQQAILGNYPEMMIQENFSRETFKNSGRTWEEIIDRSSKKPKPFIPFTGSGKGGSTSIYGAVLERFQKEDFEPARYHPNFPGSTLPPKWPISFEDLIPWYEKAERLFKLTLKSTQEKPLYPENPFWRLGAAEETVPRSSLIYFDRAN